MPAHLARSATDEIVPFLIDHFSIPEPDNHASEEDDDPGCWWECVDCPGNFSHWFDLKVEEIERQSGHTLFHDCDSCGKRIGSMMIVRDDGVPGTSCFVPTEEEDIILLSFGRLHTIHDWRCWMSARFTDPLSEDEWGILRVLEPNLPLPLDYILSEIPREPWRVLLDIRNLEAREMIFKLEVGEIESGYVIGRRWKRRLII